MHLLWQWGSFDAMSEGFEGALAEPFVKLNCEVVGSYERIAEAFEGVRISSHEEMLRWIEAPARTLPYKETDVHWLNAKDAFNPR